MSPEQWQQVKTALDQVLGATPSRRPTLLNEACGGDLEMIAEVESLLSFEENGGVSFTNSEIPLKIQDIFADEENFLLGRQIGKYKILREIGCGGMGTVFLAERTDGEFERQAAIKFLRRSFSSKPARARFAQERQILARLQHRFIAQMIDGGTTDDGTPYLVMEYVEGLPITEYITQNDLPLAQKLDLFRKICEAVSFAHRNLVVHRDLKPDNILITADGVPKLLDFGIAKLLSAGEIKATVTHLQALTPEYASPEQIAGRDITTASDIYALGIILYEILTGEHPFRHHRIVSGEPGKPSAVVSRNNQSAAADDGQKTNRQSRFANRKSLKGDLDTIVLKSLRSEPERRYDSVERFSQDVLAYLKGFPISARPDTFRYRAGKFLKRNPLASVAVLVALISLIAGIFAAGYQARRANLERARAERRFNEVRSLANSFMFEINDKIGESPIQARELLVSRAVEYLDNLAQESENDPSLESELAASYEKIGDIQAELFKPNSGKTSDALINHRKSLQIRQKLFDAEPSNLERGQSVVKSRLLVSDILSMSGKLAEARDECAATNEFSLKLLDLDPQNKETRRGLASGYARLGQLILRSGSLSETLAAYEKSREIYQQLAAENPQTASFQRSYDIILSFIGYIKIQTGETGEAVRFFNDSLIIEQKLFTQQDDLQTRGYLSTAKLWYGISLSEDGEDQNGINKIREALQMQQEIFNADEKNFGERNALADCYGELGKALLKNNQAKAAADNFRLAEENYRIVWQADRENLPTRCQIAYVQKFLGDALMKTGDRQNALEKYQSSLETMKELTAADPSNSEWQYDLALCYLKIGELQKSFKNSDFIQNLQIAQSLLEICSRHSPENIKIRRDLAAVEYLLAKN